MRKGSAVVWAVWIVLTILIAGGLVYYYQFTKIPNLQSEIDNLKNQVTELQEQINAIEEEEDDTADWETLTNSEYGFSIKFPSQWTPNEEEVAGDVVLTSITFTGSDRFWIQVTDLNEFISSTSGYSSKNLRDYVEYSQGSEGLSNTEIGGVAAVQLEKDNPDDSDKTYKGAFILKNNRVYEIFATYAKEDTEKDTIFENMLSTFQFTD